jgi:hypothetical protein
MQPTKINLGCDTNILKEWINLDCAALAGVDVDHASTCCRSHSKTNVLIRVSARTSLNT